MSSERNLRAQRAFKENVSRYRRENNHDPYFTLTPAGAKRLVECLKSEGVELSMSGVQGVTAKQLENFLIEGGFHETLLTPMVIDSLFGGISQGFHVGRVAIDPLALHSILSEKTRNR